MKMTLQKDANGTIKVSALTAWSAPPLMPPFVFLKLIRATSPDHLPEGDEGVQLVLTPCQAEDMADRLQQQLASLDQQQVPLLKS